MEKTAEIYLSLKLNLKNSAEVCNDFPPYQCSGDISILQQNSEYLKNNDCQRHFCKFVFSSKKEDIGKFQRIFWCEK